MAVDLSISVVGHEHLPYLETAPSSIFSSEIPRSFEVIFVDNDSRDGSAEFDHSREGSVDWLLGAALMMRSEVYERANGVDERYRLYWEDIDVCRRLHLEGLGVHYLPDAVVMHAHLAETDETFLTMRTFSHYKSMLQYIREHGIKPV
jgi:GT2 family glycosyltransferase